MAKLLPENANEIAVVAATKGLDLLRVRPVRALIRWRAFPYVFQVGMLMLFVGLAVISWGVFAPAGVPEKLFAKSHLATLLVWGVWWPAMVWAAVLFGRVWCMICPLELVGGVCERFGKRLGFRRRPLRRWIVSGTVIVVLYATIQLLVAGAHINRVPAYTSFFLVGLCGVAALTGLVFRDRAFCRGFCPVGVLLGVYGRGGIIAVRPGATSGFPGTEIDARTCPSLLNPSKLASNANCLVCGRCLKAAAPDQMRLLLRRPFSRADIREPGAAWPITVFVMLVSGFVMGELFTEWPVAENVFLAAPAWAAMKLGASARVGWFEGVWVLAVVPLMLWSVLAGIARLFGCKERCGDLWRRMALPMAVIVSAGHLSKGLAKFVSWAPFLPGALAEPGGAAASRAITDKSAAPPPPWLTMTTVSFIGVGLVVIAFVFAVRELRLTEADGKLRWQITVPLAFVAAGFVGIVRGWA